MFEYSKEIPLLPECGKDCLCISGSSSQTVVSSSGKQIAILREDSGMELRTTYCDYQALSYDASEPCYWAVSLECPGTLFCLSAELEEYGRVELNHRGKKLGDIEGLYYNNFNKTLCVVADRQLYCVSPAGNTQRIVTLDPSIEKLEGICGYLNHMICLVTRGDVQQLCILSGNDGTIMEVQTLQKGGRMVSMTMIQEAIGSVAFSLRFLAVRQDGAQYIVDYKPDAEFFYQFAMPCLSAAEYDDGISGLHMQQLGARGMGPMFCPGGRRQSSLANCRAPLSRQSGYPDSQSCKDMCSNCGRPKAPEPGHCCIPGAGASCTDIIESIALTETSIAHILNAEGEKLQRAIACSCDVSELLKVNESVLKTIIHSTQLEQMLYYKLEAVLNADCCVPSPCDCPTPCPCMCACDSDMDTGEETMDDNDENT